MNELHSPATDHQPDEDFFGRLALALEGTADRDAVVQQFVDERPELASEVRELADLDGQLKTTSSRTEQFRPGDRLGEFRIVRLIAVGGMGEVYEAEQESLVVFQPNKNGQLRRRVAIKVIRPGKISDEYRARFLREQAVLARLHQTHVVPVHTAGQQDGIAYFAMPYIRGAALNHVLDATYNETKAHHSTPTLGAMASRMASSAATKISSDASLQIPTKTFQSGAAASRSPRRSLGREAVAMTLPYFRSVAVAVAEAAEAVQHAHDAQIVHRDLKPSNIMVDADGHCWIIDFGLAGALSARTTADEVAETQLPGQPSANPLMHTLPGLLGTIPYLAPEQLDGHADARSDVYGLGATLYELCTWRAPFAPINSASVHRIRTEVVRPPCELASGLPADLNAICHKALAKSPDQRYQSAQELADDLRRWLNHTPTVALPARAPRRAWLWSRRNPGWAAALGTLLLVLLVAVYTQGALLVEARTRELLAEIERNRSATKHDGWFDTFWQLARQSALIDPTVDLRSLAATGLAGPDARLQHRFPIHASSVAFDRAGKRLLMGGTTGQPAKLWNGTLHSPIASKLTGEGPVAFAADGTPLQLVLNAEGRLVLWNVTSNTLLREFEFPDADLQASALELSADGRMIGACGQSANGKRGLIAVWKRESGELVMRLERPALSLAFTPDGSLLAAGDRDGRVGVWRVSDGTPTVEDLSADRAGIKALAFGLDPRTAGQSGNRRLLAAGDDSGTIVVWDLARKSPRSFCHGSSHHIHSLRFSPDGITLGSVGRGDVKLWDTTTGRLVLSIHERNWLTDLAFSPDGMSVAVSSLPAFDDLGNVSVWQLELGRGIQTFRGLGQPITTAVFSPDERYVAALAHDSRVGVWDRQTERLMHVFEAPKSLWVDNAALMFSPDSKLLACSGSSDHESHARLWDIASGQQVAAWTLPPGLNQLLAFPRMDELLLFQVELEKGGQFPDGSRHPREYPRVGRLYDLRRGQAAQKRRFEITEFQWLIEFPMMPEDGRFIAVKGLSGKDRPTGRRVKVFDTRSGGAIWSGPTETENLNQGTSGLMLDRSGKFLTDELKSIIELPSGKFLDVPPRGATDGHRWSPEMPYYVDGQKQLLSLIPRGQTERVLDLDRDSKGCSVRKQFSPKGGLFVWGNLDGTVQVCDIAEARRRLTEIGLGW